MSLLYKEMVVTAVRVLILAKGKKVILCLLVCKTKNSFIKSAIKLYSVCGLLQEAKIIGIKHALEECHLKNEIIKQPFFSTQI